MLSTSVNATKPTQLRDNDAMTTPLCKQFSSNKILLTRCRL
jgi:hypothetical protein